MRARSILVPAFRLGLLGLVGLGAVAPASAGTVYLPLAVDHEIEGTNLETEVRITNTSETTVRHAATFFIPSLADGMVDKERVAETAKLAPGASTILNDLRLPGLTGFLEIHGSGDIVVSGRLLGTTADQRSTVTEIPAVGPDEIFAPGDNAYLQGWSRLANLRTDFHLLNLGEVAATCNVALRRINGALEQGSVPLSVPAKSHVPYFDALDAVGISRAGSMSSAVTCDQPFWAYLTLHDRSTGEVDFIAPSRSAGPLDLPDDGPEDPSDPPPDNPPPDNPPPDDPPQDDPPPGDDGGAGCDSANVFCFKKSGVFYTPSPSESVRREIFNLPAGNYKRIHFRVDVKHGGWKPPTKGLHSLFWLAVDGHYDLIGFSGLWGPNTNAILFRHGMNLVAGNKPKFVRQFKAVPGETYSIDFDFNPGQRVLHYKVFDSKGTLMYSVTDRPNVTSIPIPRGEKLMADFSTRKGQNPNEPPTYGWQYKNLDVRVYR